MEEGLDRYVRFLKAEGMLRRRASPPRHRRLRRDLRPRAGHPRRSTPAAVFFGGQIVFPEDSFLTRLLFNHTTFAVQRRLHQLGIPFLVMPVRVE